VNGQLDTSAALTPGKEVPVSVTRRLGGPRLRSGRFEEEEEEEEKYSFLLPEYEARLFGSPICSPVPTPTWLLQKKTYHKALLV